MKTLFTEGLECLQSTLSCTSIKNPLRPLTLLKLISKQINKQKMDHWKNISYFRLSPCFRTLRKNHNRRSVLPFCLRKNITLSRAELIQKPLFWPLSNRLPAPGGGLPYMGYIVMCHCEGYGFQTAVYFGIGYINLRVWVLNTVSFSRKLINCLKILVLTKGTRNCHSKIY